MERLSRNCFEDKVNRSCGPAITIDGIARACMLDFRSGTEYMNVEGSYAVLQCLKKLRECCCECVES